METTEGRHAGDGVDTAATTRAALALTKIIAEVIADCGPEGAPSGILYAAVMEFGISFATYNSIIGMLKAAGLVTEDAHVLVWVGGPLP